jgi:hypothetical protein
VIRPTTVVVRKLNDGVGVVGEQGGQEGMKYTPLRGPGVEDQPGRCIVAYSYYLETACQEVQDPVAAGGV